MAHDAQRMTVLFIAEHEDGRLKRYSMELAGKACALSNGAPVTGLLLGSGLDAPANELARYAQRVVCAKSPCLKGYAPQTFADAICAVIKKEEPDVVLATSSVSMRDTLARAAMRLACGFVPDCTDISADGDAFTGKRAMYGARIEAEVTVRGHPVFFSVLPNIFPIPSPLSASGEAVKFAPVLKAPILKVVERLATEGASLDIAEADRIVAGGRGAGREGFALIGRLAKMIGAAVGASRSAVDAGVISHDHQVGQTGKAVNPMLYIACAISGAQQHMAGIRGARVVVAVNRDPEAPIFSKADYGIQGDMFKVLPELIKNLKAL